MFYLCGAGHFFFSPLFIDEFLVDHYQPEGIFVFLDNSFTKGIILAILISNDLFVGDQLCKINFEMLEDPPQRASLTSIS